MTTLFNTSSSNTSIKYGIHDFLYRFKKLQNICNTLKLDGIMIICGFDSRNNLEYNKLTSWLFIGDSGNQVDDEIFLDDIFREFVFIITKDSALAYVEPDLFEMIKKYLLAIPNIHIFQPSEKQMDNQDHVELLKIAQFYKMTDNLKTVGFALSKKDEKDIKNIEKWPILQAFALDEIGKGFFSMSHMCMDITDVLNDVYKYYDRYSLCNLINTTLAQIKHYVKTVCFGLENIPMNKRCTLAEETLNENLQDPYDYSFLAKKNFLKPDGLPTPRILYGTNTNLDFNQKSSKSTLANTSYGENPYAFHYTLEYVDPLSKVRLARTYFATLNYAEDYITDPIHDEFEKVIGYELKTVKNRYYDDERYLINLYGIVIYVYNKVVEYLAENMKELEEAYVGKLVRDELAKFKDLQINMKNVMVTLRCLDSYGNEVKPNIFNETPDFINYNVCALRIQIKDIQSIVEPGTNIGSLIFCDSFYMQPGFYHLLTNEVPYIDFWASNAKHSEAIEKIKDAFYCPELGKPLTETYENNFLYVPPKFAFITERIDSPLIPINLRLYEKGLKLYGPKIGYKVILFKDIETAISLLKLDKPGIQLAMPRSHLLQDISQGYVVIFFSGLAIQKLFLKLPQMLIDLSIPHKNFSDEVPEYITQSLTLKNSGYFTSVNYKIIGNNIKNKDYDLFSSYIQLQQMLKIAMQKDLTFKLYYKIATTPEESKTATEINKNNNKFQFIFVNGISGSGKHKFAENLAGYSQLFGIKIHVFKKKFDELIGLTGKKYVGDMLNFLEQNKVKKGEKIIAVLPPSINTKLVIDNLGKIIEFNENCVIQAVVTKINLNNFYKSENKEVNENFLSYCNTGYSQFVLLDHYQQKEAEITSMYEFLKELLPYSYIYRLTNNRVQESIAKDILYYDGFDSKINKLERKKTISFKIPEKQYIYFPIKFPLNRARLGQFYQNVFHDCKGYLYTTQPPQPVDKSKSIKDQEVEQALEELNFLISRVKEELNGKCPRIYCVKGFVRLEENLEEVYELSLNSNYMIINALKKIKGVVKKEGMLHGMEKVTIDYQGSYNSKDIGILFYGENLEEVQMKELLKNYVKPVKEKLKLRTRESLTEEEIRKIEIDNRGRGLENGEFFDGWRFRDLDNHMLEHHPKLDMFIEEYLAEENAKIGSANRNIEKEWKILEQLWDN